MSYEYRKDVRSDKQMKKNIKDGTSNERKAIKQFFEHFILPKHPDAKLEDFGVDNTGKIIKEGKVTQASDNIVKCKKWKKPKKYEMKVSTFPCVTFKEDQVKNWLEEKEIVLWVVNFGKKNVKYYEMSAETSLKVFQEHGIYKAYFGPKTGWRLFENQLDSLQKKYKYKSYTI